MNEDITLRIDNLQRELDSLKKANTIPYDVDSAFRSRLQLPRSGTYTPTLTGNLNVNSSGAFVTQYIEINDSVIVSGRVTVDPTSTGLTQLGISLPIKSNFSAAEDCTGTASSITIPGESGGIVADTTSETASMQWEAGSNSSRDMYFIFMYRKQ